jgi:hypothetical protein
VGLQVQKKIAVNDPTNALVAASAAKARQSKVFFD